MTDGERGNAIAQAFDLRPDPAAARDAAVLCLHGLTATPYSVLAVGEALAARGLRARGPWMAGHEGGAASLAATSHIEWIEQARHELLRLRGEHAKVFLVGVSMGGLVSLRLAQTEAIDGLVVVGTPLALPRAIALLAPVARHFWSYRRKQGSDIQDPVARASHPGLDVMPIASVVEILKLQAKVRADLGRIRAPILVSHGRLDRTADPEDASRIHSQVASSEKELFYLERSGHVATVDYDGPALARAAADFLARRTGDPERDVASGQSSRARSVT